MSSIEDLCLASSSISPKKRDSSPLKNENFNNVEQVQNELDQLHDKLDELTRENQTLKSRAQEFDTIYEENEYLYAEKLHWNEEIERARVRELILQQEIRSLKEREREFLLKNDSTEMNNLNSSQLKMKIEWLYQTNNKLDLEISNLRDQLDSMTKKNQEIKKDFFEKEKHFQEILSINEDQQKLPQVHFQTFFFLN